MPVVTRSPLAEAIRNEVHLLTGDDRSDYGPLLDLIGSARFVLLGEATHGTHEFYRERAAITRKLIREKGFTAVAVEADWPDANRVNRYIRHASDDRSPDEALSGFKRFPQWMWRNEDMVHFTEWLHAHNAGLPAESRVGFYGLDLYSLFSSIGSVLAFLDKTDPQAAARARYRYSCFEHFHEDAQAYGYSAGFRFSPSCEEQVVEELRDLMDERMKAARDGEFFSAEQNAFVITNAERYYREMFAGKVNTWNIRDRHMSDTLERLAAFLDSQGRKNKIVVWAHNSHIGDARATEMGWSGELNIGQLTKQKHGKDSVLIGFTTTVGTVTAADNWDEPAQWMRVNPAVEGSIEHLFHETHLPKFFLPLRDGETLRRALGQKRLERAIGVIYRPQTERLSHYFEAEVSNQFDGVFHFEHTKAVVPLERTPAWQPEEIEAPETFPTGL